MTPSTRAVARGRAPDQRRVDFLDGGASCKESKRLHSRPKTASQAARRAHGTHSAKVNPALTWAAARRLRWFGGFWLGHYQKGGASERRHTSSPVFIGSDEFFTAATTTLKPKNV